MSVNDMPFSLFGYALLLQLTMLPNLHLQTRDGITRPIPTIDSRLDISQVYKFEPHSLLIWGAIYALSRTDRIKSVLIGSMPIHIAFYLPIFSCQELNVRVALISLQANNGRKEVEALR